MALISEADAIQILGERVYDLRNVMLGAWDDYLDYASAHRRLHCPTTRAGIVHDHIKHRARERFENDPSIHVLEINRLLLMVIRQQLVVRFKLFHPNKTSSNIRTKQIEDYRKQRDIPELRRQIDFAGHLSNLEAGYILDQLESKILETWLVCPSGVRANAWSYEIRDRHAAAGLPQSSVTPLFPSTTTVEPKETTVVTIKRPDTGDDSS